MNKTFNIVIICMQTSTVVLLILNSWIAEKTMVSCVFAETVAILTYDKASMQYLII